MNQINYVTAREAAKLFRMGPLTLRVYLAEAEDAPQPYIIGEQELYDVEELHIFIQNYREWRKDKPLSPRTREGARLHDEYLQERGYEPIFEKHFCD